MGCPYSGDVDPRTVNEVTNKLLEMGCYEVSLGDTIGAGTVEKTRRLLDTMTVSFEKLAAHFHDTGNTAIECILVALEKGVSAIDSSVGGLGGCPYAKTSAGNVCTENVVGVLHALGIKTGVDLVRLSEIGETVCKATNRENVAVGLKILESL